MSSSTITCLSVGVYEDALTRGKHYEVLQMDNRKKQIRIRGDNQHIRWFPMILFDLTGSSAPTLTEWWLLNPPHENIWTEVGIRLSDGTYRFCLFATISKVERMLTLSDPLPGMWYANLIIVHTEADEFYTEMLTYLDQHGQLIQASKLMDLPDENGGSV